MSAAAARAFEVAGRQVYALRNRAVDLARVEALQFGRGNGRAKNPEHRARVKAARHDGRNELGRHPLHDLVTGGDRRQELLAGGAGDFRRGERGWQDRDAGMSEHAEGIPFSAGKDHLGIDKGGPSLGELRAVTQYGRGPAAAFLLFLHQRQRLPARWHVLGNERRAQRLQRDALGAVNDLQRQVLVAEISDKGCELSAQRHDGSLRSPVSGASGRFAATRRITKSAAIGSDRSPARDPHRSA